MIGILYFSSTGNSLQIAKSVQTKFGGEIKFIPKYAGDGSEYEKIFIITPIYSFGLPTPVFELLPRLNKQSEIFVIQNYGGMIGRADVLFYKYAIKNQLNIKSINTIKMPENYTLIFTVPKFYLNRILKTAGKRIDALLTKLQNGEYNIPKVRKTKETTYLKNKSNWHIIGERFNVNENCIKCKKCVNICPVNNIKLENGKITFGNNCIACLACYHRCPKLAIQYLNKRKKYRYTNPNVEENEIGKDL